MADEMTLKILADISSFKESIQQAKTTYTEAKDEIEQNKIDAVGGQETAQDAFKYMMDSLSQADKVLSDIQNAGVQLPLSIQNAMSKLVSGTKQSLTSLLSYTGQATTQFDKSFDLTRFNNQIRFSSASISAYVDDLKQAMSLAQSMDQETQQIFGKNYKQISSLVAPTLQSLFTKHHREMKDSEIVSELLNGGTEYSYVRDALSAMGITGKKQQEQAISFAVKTSSNRIFRQDAQRPIFDAGLTRPESYVFATDVVKPSYRAAYASGGQFKEGMTRNPRISTVGKQEEFYERIKAEILAGNSVAFKAAKQAKLIREDKGGEFRFLQKNSLTDYMLDQFAGLVVEERKHAAEGSPQYRRDLLDPKNAYRLVEKENKRIAEADRLIRADEREGANPYIDPNYITVMENKETRPKQLRYDQGKDSYHVSPELTMPELINIPRMALRKSETGGAPQLMVKRYEKQPDGSFKTVYQPNLNFGWQKEGVRENQYDEWITMGRNPILDRLIKLHSGEGAEFKDRTFGYGFDSDGKAAEGTPLIFSVSVDDLRDKDKWGNVKFLETTLPNGKPGPKKAYFPDNMDELIDRITRGEVRPVVKDAKGQDLELRMFAGKPQGEGSMLFMANKDFEELERQDKERGITSMLRYFNEVDEHGDLINPETGYAYRRNDTDEKTQDELAAYRRYYDARNKILSHSIPIEELGGETPTSAIINLGAIYDSIYGKSELNKRFKFDGGGFIDPSVYSKDFQARMGPAKFLAQRFNWRTFFNDAKFSYTGADGKKHFYLPGMGTSAKEYELYRDLYKDIDEQAKEYSYTDRQGNKQEGNFGGLTFAEWRDNRFVDVMDEQYKMLLADTVFKGSPLKSGLITADAFDEIANAAKKNNPNSSFLKTRIVRPESEYKQVDGKAVEHKEMIKLTPEQQTELLSIYADPKYGMGLRLMKDTENYAGDKDFWSPAYMSSVMMTPAMMARSAKNYAKAFRQMSTTEGIIKRLFSGHDYDSRRVTENPNLIYEDPNIKYKIAAEREDLEMKQLLGYGYFPGMSHMLVATANPHSVFNPIGRDLTGHDALGNAAKLNVGKYGVIAPNVKNKRRINGKEQDLITNWTRSPYAPGSSFFAKSLESSFLSRYGLTSDSAMFNVEDFYQLNTGDFDGDFVWAQQALSSDKEFQELTDKRNQAVLQLAERFLQEKDLKSRIIKKFKTDIDFDPRSFAAALNATQESATGPTGMGYKVSQAFRMGLFTPDEIAKMDTYGNQTYDAGIEMLKKVGVDIMSPNGDVREAIRTRKPFERLSKELVSEYENKNSGATDIFSFGLPTYVDPIGTAILSSAKSGRDASVTYGKKLQTMLEANFEGRYGDEKYASVRDLAKWATDLIIAKATGKFQLTSTDTLQQGQNLVELVENDLNAVIKAQGVDSDEAKRLRQFVSHANSFIDTERTIGFTEDNLPIMADYYKRMNWKNAPRANGYRTELQATVAAIEYERNRDKRAQAMEDAHMAQLDEAIKQKTGINPKESTKQEWMDNILAAEMYTGFNWSNAKYWGDDDLEIPDAEKILRYVPLNKELTLDEGTSYERKYRPQIQRYSGRFRTSFHAHEDELARNKNNIARKIIANVDKTDASLMAHALVGTAAHEYFDTYIKTRSRIHEDRRDAEGRPEYYSEKEAEAAATEAFFSKLLGAKNAEGIRELSPEQIEEQKRAQVSFREENGRIYATHINKGTQKQLQTKLEKADFSETSEYNSLRNISRNYLEPLLGGERGRRVVMSEGISYMWDPVERIMRPAEAEKDRRGIWTVPMRDGEKVIPFKRTKVDKNGRTTQVDAGTYFTPDMVYENPDGTYTIADYKSGLSGQEDAIFQTAYYAHQLEELGKQYYRGDRSLSRFARYVKYDSATDTFTSNISKLEALNAFAEDPMRNARGERQGGHYNAAREFEHPVLQADYTQELGDLVAKWVEGGYANLARDAKMGFINQIGSEGLKADFLRTLIGPRGTIAPGENENDYRHTELSVEDSMRMYEQMVEIAAGRTGVRDSQDNFIDNDKSFLVQKYKEDKEKLDEVRKFSSKKYMMLNNTEYGSADDFTRNIQTAMTLFDQDDFATIQEYYNRKGRAPDVPLMLKNFSANQAAASEEIQRLLNLRQQYHNQMFDTMQEDYGNIIYSDNDVFSKLYTANKKYNQDISVIAEERKRSAYYDENVAGGFATEAEEHYVSPNVTKRKGESDAEFEKRKQEEEQKAWQDAIALAEMNRQERDKYVNEEQEAQQAYEQALQAIQYEIKENAKSEGSPLLQVLKGGSFDKAIHGLRSRAKNFEQLGSKEYLNGERAGEKVFTDEGLIRTFTSEEKRLTEQADALLALQSQEEIDPSYLTQIINARENYKQAQLNYQITGAPISSEIEKNLALHNFAIDYLEKNGNLSLLNEALSQFGQTYDINKEEELGLRSSDKKYLHVKQREYALSKKEQALRDYNNAQENAKQLYEIANTTTDPEERLKLLQEAAVIVSEAGNNVSYANDLIDRSSMTGRNFATPEFLKAIDFNKTFRGIGAVKGEQDEVAKPPKQYYAPLMESVEPETVPPPIQEEKEEPKEQDNIQSTKPKQTKQYVLSTKDRKGITYQRAVSYNARKEQEEAQKQEEALPIQQQVFGPQMPKASEEPKEEPINARDKMLSGLDLSNVKMKGFSVNAAKKYIEELRGMSEEEYAAAIQKTNVSVNRRTVNRLIKDAITEQPKQPIVEPPKEAPVILSLPAAGETLTRDEFNAARRKAAEEKVQEETKGAEFRLEKAREETDAEKDLAKIQIAQADKRKELALAEKNLSEAERKESEAKKAFDIEPKKPTQESELRAAEERFTERMGEINTMFDGRISSAKQKSEENREAIESTRKRISEIDAMQPVDHSESKDKYIEMNDARRRLSEAKAKRDALVAQRRQRISELDDQAQEEFDAAYASISKEKDENMNQMYARGSLNQRRQKELDDILQEKMQDIRDAQNPAKLAGLEAKDKELTGQIKTVRAPVLEKYEEIRKKSDASYTSAIEELNKNYEAERQRLISNKSLSETDREAQLTNLDEAHNRQVSEIRANQYLADKKIKEQESAEVGSVIAPLTKERKSVRTDIGRIKDAQKYLDTDTWIGWLDNWYASKNAAETEGKEIMREYDDRAKPLNASERSLRTQLAFKQETNRFTARLEYDDQIKELDEEIARLEEEATTKQKEFGTIRDKKEEEEKQYRTAKYKEKATLENKEKDLLAAQPSLDKDVKNLEHEKQQYVNNALLGRTFAIQRAETFPHEVKTDAEKAYEAAKQDTEGARSTRDKLIEEEAKIESDRIEAEKKVTAEREAEAEALRKESEKHKFALVEQKEEEKKPEEPKTEPTTPVQQTQPPAPPITTQKPVVQTPQPQQPQPPIQPQPQPPAQPQPSAQPQPVSQPPQPPVPPPITYTPVDWEDQGGTSAQEFTDVNDGRTYRARARASEYMRRAIETRDKLRSMPFDELSDFERSQLKDLEEYTSEGARQANILKLEGQYMQEDALAEDMAKLQRDQQFDQIAHRNEMAQAQRDYAYAQQNRNLWGPSRSKFANAYRSQNQTRISLERAEKDNRFMAQQAQDRVDKLTEKFGSTIYEGKKISYKDYKQLSEEDKKAYGETAAKDASAIKNTEESIKGYTAAANDAAAQAQKFTPALMGVRSAFTGISQSVTTLLSRFGRQVFQKALNEAKQFVKQFNKTMTEIQMITLKSDTQMSTLGDGLINKAKELKVSIAEISQSAATLYRQGLTDEEVDERLDVISKFSKVSGAKVGDATKLITVAMNTGLVTDPQQAADIVTALGDNAATNAQQIEKGIEKAGAAAAADGTTFAELAAMLTAITSTTQIGGNVAGRTLNTIFGRMNKIGTNELITDENGNMISGSAVAKLLKAQGIDMYENGNKRSSYSVLSDLSKKWDDMSDAEQQQIANAIAGTRQYSNFAAIMQGMSEGKVDEYLELAGEAEGITDKKFDIYSQSLEASLTNFKNIFDETINSLVEKGTIENIVQGLGDIVTGIGEIISISGGLPGIIATFGTLAVVMAGIRGGAPGAVAMTAILAGLGIASAVGSAKRSSNENSAQNKYNAYIDTQKNKYNAYVSYASERKTTANDIISAQNALYEQYEETGKLSKEQQKSYQDNLDSLAKMFPDLSSTIEASGTGIENWTSILSASEKAISQFSETAIDQAHQLAKSVHRDINKQAREQIKEIEDTYGSEKTNTKKADNLKSFLISMDQSLENGPDLINVADAITIADDASDNIKNLYKYIMGGELSQEDAFLVNGTNGKKVAGNWAQRLVDIGMVKDLDEFDEKYVKRWKTAVGGEEHFEMRSNKLASDFYDFLLRNDYQGVETNRNIDYGNNAYGKTNGENYRRNKNIQQNAKLLKTMFAMDFDNTGLDEATKGILLGTYNNEDEFYNDALNGFETLYAENGKSDYLLQKILSPLLHSLQSVLEGGENNSFIEKTLAEKNEQIDNVVAEALLSHITTEGALNDITEAEAKHIRANIVDQYGYSGLLERNDLSDIINNEIVKLQQNRTGYMQNDNTLPYSYGENYFQTEDELRNFVGQRYDDLRGYLNISREDFINNEIGEQNPDTLNDVMDRMALSSKDLKYKNEYAGLLREFRSHKNIESLGNVEASPYKAFIEEAKDTKLIEMWQALQSGSDQYTYDDIVRYLENIVYGGTGLETKNKLLNTAYSLSDMKSNLSAMKSTAGGNERLFKTISSATGLDVGWIRKNYDEAVKEYENEIALKESQYQQDIRTRIESDYGENKNIDKINEEYEKYGVKVTKNENGTLNYEFSDTGTATPYEELRDYSAVFTNAQLANVANKVKGLSWQQAVDQIGPKTWSEDELTALTNYSPDLVRYMKMSPDQQQSAEGQQLLKNAQNQIDLDTANVSILSGVQQYATMKYQQTNESGLAAKNIYDEMVSGGFKNVKDLNDAVGKEHVEDWKKLLESAPELAHKLDDLGVKITDEGVDFSGVEGAGENLAAVIQHIAELVGQSGTDLEKQQIKTNADIYNIAQSTLNGTIDREVGMSSIEEIIGENNISKRINNNLIDIEKAKQEQESYYNRFMSVPDDQKAQWALEHPMNQETPSVYSGLSPLEQQYVGFKMDRYAVGQQDLSDSDKLSLLDTFLSQASTEGFVKTLMTTAPEALSPVTNFMSQDYMQAATLLDQANGGQGIINPETGEKITLANISDVQEGTEAYAELEKVFANMPNGINRAKDAEKDFEKGLNETRTRVIKPYGKDTDEIIEKNKKFTGTIREQNEALKSYRSATKSILNNQFIRDQFKNGKTNISGMREYIEGLGFDKKDIDDPKKRQEIIDAMHLDELADSQEFENEVAAAFGNMNDKFNEYVQQNPIEVDGQTVNVGEGHLEISTEQLLSDFGAALDDTQNALIQDALARGVKIQWNVDWAGEQTTITPTVSDLGQGRKSGGGGGGGGKSELDKLLAQQKRRTAPIEHEGKMLDIAYQGMDFRNDYEGMSGNIDQQIANNIRLIKEYKQSVQELQNLRANTKDEDELDKIDEQIRTLQENIASLGNTIDELNSKRIEVKQSEWDEFNKPIEHRQNMLNKYAQLAMSEDRFADYERFAQQDMDENRTKIMSNQAQIEAWKEELANYEQNSDAWIEIRDKIWALEEQNAELDNQFVQQRLELNQQRLSQIAKVVQQNTLTATHNQGIASTYADAYQQGGYHDQYVQMIGVQMKSNEEIIAENKASEAAAQAEVDRLAAEGREGSTEWFNALEAVYQYQDAVAQATVSQMALNRALQEAELDKIAKEYSDVAGEVSHTNDMLSKFAQNALENNDYEGYYAAMDKYLKNLPKQMAAAQKKLEDLKKQYAEGMANGTLDPEMQRTLLEQIRQAEAEVYDLELDEEAKKREVFKTKIDQFVENSDWATSNYEHNQKLLGYETSKYQTNGELTNYGRMVEADTKMRQKRLKTLDKEKKSLEELLKQAEPGSEEEKRLTELIKKNEEARAGENSQIEKNNKLLEENKQKILQIQKSLVDTVDKEIEAEKKRQREMLSANVSMQQTIVELLKKRMQEEWNLKKQDIEKEKESLNEYKKLINERFNYRKKAAQQADKEEELADYRRQLALIEADPTRTKDAKELRRKIAELEKEQAWAIAEDELNAENERIDEQVEGMDKFVQYNEELLNEILGDANNFADEMNDILSGSFEESYEKIMEFMQKENEAFMKSLPDAQKQMIQGWEDTWKKAKGVRESNYKEIEEALDLYDENGKLRSYDELSGGDYMKNYINYMKKNNEDYLTAKQEGDKLTMKLLVNEWKKNYGNFLSSIKDDAAWEEDDHTLGDVVSSVDKLKDETFKVNIEDITGKAAEAYGLSDNTVKAKDFSDNMELILADLSGIYKAITGDDSSPSGDPGTSSGDSGNSNPSGGKKKEKEKGKDVDTSWEAYIKYYLAGDDSPKTVFGSGVGKNAAEAQQKAYRAAFKKLPNNAKNVSKPVYYKRYDAGGLVNYTGPAWVDGTKARPEAFLSAVDTENIRSMLDMFNYVKINSAHSFNPEIPAGNNSVGDINITINQAELKSDADFDKVAKRVGQAFSKELQRNGLNLSGYSFG